MAQTNRIVYEACQPEIDDRRACVSIHPSTVSTEYFTNVIDGALRRRQSPLESSYLKDIFGDEIPQLSPGAASVLAALRKCQGCLLSRLRKKGIIVFDRDFPEDNPDFRQNYLPLFDGTGGKIRRLLRRAPVQTITCNLDASFMLFIIWLYPCQKLLKSLGYEPGPPYVRFGPDDLSIVQVRKDGSAICYLVASNKHWLRWIWTEVEEWLIPDDTGKLSSATTVHPLTGTIRRELQMWLGNPRWNSSPFAKLISRWFRERGTLN
ncbi:MAG: hypothetical protein ACYCOU_06720 [Sulfobacillus sp.]